MPYEVEKRARIPDDTEHARVSNWLHDHTLFLETASLVTYLFRDPHYLRLRFVKGSDTAWFTHKAGSSIAAVRKETQVKLDFTEASSLFDILKEIGFQRCVRFESTTHSYKRDDLRIDLSTFEGVGHILDIEKVTDNRADASTIEKTIDAYFREMDLTPLEPDAYQVFLDQLYDEKEADARWID